jgi:hypothetical protein
MQCCGPENCGRREPLADSGFERICWEDNTCAAWRWSESEYEDVEAWEEFDLKTRLNTYMTKGEGYHKLVFDPTQGGWEKIEGVATGSRDVSLFRRLRIHRKGYCGLAGKPDLLA